MSGAKRHHLVPQFYLKQFANEKGQIHVVDLKDGRQFETGVKNAAVETGFFTALDDDGNETLVAEETLSLLEQDASAAIERLITHGLPLSESDRLHLAVFLGIQINRTRFYRGWIEELTDFFGRMSIEMKIRNSTDEDLRASMSVMDEPASDAQLKSARDLVDQEGIERFSVGSPGNNRSIALILDVGIKAVPYFMERRWYLMQGNESVFLTSDRPVGLWGRPDPNLPFDAIGIGTAQEIYFPLNSDRVLAMSSVDHGPERTLEADPTIVKAVNNIICRDSERMVFHHPDLRPEYDLSAWRESEHVVWHGGVEYRGPNLWNQLRKEFFRLPGDQTNAKSSEDD